MIIFKNITDNPAKTLLVVFLAGLLSGITAGWYLYRSTPIVETHKPAAIQSDGSVVLERNPEAKPEAPKPKLPAGKHERTVVVKVKPKPQPKPEPSLPGKDGFCPVAKECPALTVRLDLVGEYDGRRVVASSPDGDIVGGIDIPIEKWVKRNENLWAAGITYGSDRTGAKAIGAFIDRDLGPFRIGIEADQDAARIRAGLRF